MDSVPPDTPIREIVDRCGVWESHADQNRRPPPGTNVGQEHPAVASDSRESSFYTEDPLMTDTHPVFEAKVPLSMVHDGVDDGAVFRGELDRIVSDRYASCAGLRELLPGAGDCSGGGRGTEDHAGGGECTCPVYFSGRAAPAGGMSQTISSAGEPGGGKLGEARWQQLLSPQGALTHIPVEPVMVCFLCGCSGHGVSRCSRLDTVFPSLPLGWSVDFRDGQYRAVWPMESPGCFQLGNED